MEVFFKVFFFTHCILLSLAELAEIIWLINHNTYIYWFHVRCFLFYIIYVVVFKVTKSWFCLFCVFSYRLVIVVM